MKIYIDFIKKTTFFKS